MSKAVNNTHIDRRSFFRILGWSSFFAALAMSVGSGFRFLFPRVLFEKAPVFTIGLPDTLTSGEGQDGFHVYETWKEEQSVWIVRQHNRLYAMHSRCTHLGCTPNWFSDEGVFKCPCHGSQYKSNGENFTGPAPRPLDRFRIFVRDDKMIYVDKSRAYTFREFNKPGAYLEI